MIRSESHAARPLRGRGTFGLWNPIETRKAFVDLCSESKIHHTSLAAGPGGLSVSPSAPCACFDRGRLVGRLKRDSQRESDGYCTEPAGQRLETRLVSQEQAGTLLAYADFGTGDHDVAGSLRR